MKNKENLAFTLANPAVPSMVKDSVDLINHFYEQKLMLPADLGHYEELADKGKLAVAVSTGEGVIGTTSYVQEYPNGQWEIGGMAVSPDWQKLGVGFKLLNTIMGLWQYEDTIAFANENSAPLIKKFGAVEITDMSKVAPEALGLCNKCPAKPESGCCDTILSLAPGVANLIMEGFSYEGLEKKPQTTSWKRTWERDL